MSERRLQNAIRLALGQIDGCVFWRNNVGFDRERRVKYGLGVGSADLIGCVNGKFVGIEIKTDKGRVSDEQKLWHECVERNGGHVFVVRSTEEAVEAVERVKNWKQMMGRFDK